jgi:hypothetical protein
VALWLLGVGCGAVPATEHESPPAGVATPAVESPCRLEGRLTGAVDRSVQWDRAEACGTPIVVWAERTVTLSWAEPRVLLFGLAITGLGEPRAQSGLGATVTLRQSNGNGWRTPPGACQVDVTAFRFLRDTALGRSYRIAGRGHCAKAALPMAPAGGAAISIGDFTFTASPLL